jgi:hypothetical protein
MVATDLPAVRDINREFLDIMRRTQIGQADDDGFDVKSSREVAQVFPGTFLVVFEEAGIVEQQAIFLWPLLQREGWQVRWPPCCCRSV